MNNYLIPNQIPNAYIQNQFTNGGEPGMSRSSTLSTYSSVFIDQQSNVNHTPNLFANFTSNSLPIFQQSHQGHPSSTSIHNGPPGPQNVQTSNPTAAPNALDKPLINSLTLQQFITIINEANKPIKDKLNLISQDLHGNMTAMDHRIEFLENENEKKDEENSTLKLTIGNGFGLT